MQCFIIHSFFLSGIELQTSSKRIFLLCSTTVLHGRQKSLLPDSQKFVPNFSARNAADLLPCFSDGFDFLLSDGENVEPGGWSRTLEKSVHYQ